MGKTIKIIVSGPESTGKTMLSESLATHYKTVFTPEFAREFIEQLDRPYRYEDVEFIARRQIELEKDYLAKANKILFCDTWLVITKYWFKVVYNRVPGWLENHIIHNLPDFCLLCYYDIPWEPDGIRENPGLLRRKLFRIYREELIRLGLPYCIVKGKNEARFQNAIEAVDNFLNNL